MPDEEIRAAIRAARGNCHDDDELRRRIREATGYSGHIAVTSTSTSCGRSTMTMFMVMLRDPRGNTIRI